MPLRSFLTSSLVIATAWILVAWLPSPATQPNGKAQTSSDEPFRWDGLRAGQPPRMSLFSAEFSAGMFPRPKDLSADTWFHDGHLRTYALLNLGRVVKCVEIQRGDGPVWMFGNARAPDLLEMATITIQEEGFPKVNVAISLRELISLLNCQGILVVRNGKIVFEEYAGMDPAQRHHWMSISKATLNMLLGRLVAHGQIAMGRRVDEYLPELKGKGYGAFTVQELADMDADVDVDEKNYHDPKSHFWDFGRSMGWFQDDGKWPGGCKQFLTTVIRLEKPKGEAGLNVRYTSSNSQVLGWIVEKITGESLTDHFAKNVWHHIGAVANASVSVDKQGFPFAGGGYSSTLRDLARFGTIWANRGIAPDGTRIFSEDWLVENTSGKGPKIRDYRYHNHSYSKGTAITHQGHSGQMLWVNPESGTIIACFGSTTTPGGGNTWSRQAYLRLAETLDRHLREKKIAEKK